jgi:Fe-S cluster assembly protein SufD
MTTTQLSDAFKFDNRADLGKGVNDLRQNAYHNTLALGLPHRRVESWKYTNLNSLPLSLLDTHLGHIDLTPFIDNNFHNIFFIDGKLHSQSDLSVFNITTLNDNNLEVIKKNNNLLKNDFASELNLAAMQSGHHLELRENAKVTRPVLIYHIYTSNEAKLTATHLSFNIQKNSKVDVLEVYHTTENKSEMALSLGHSINVQNDAIFNHAQLQSIANSAYFLNNNKAQVDQNAQYNSVMVLVGAKLSRTNIAIDLNSTNASCMAHGLYAMQAEQHCDVMSSIYHHALETKTEQLFKGILNDKARGIFTGLIHMDKEAQRSNASQLNKNLLLSQGAHANSRPQLEIFADDVKCSHGSTTGQLNQDELFYFMARGIKKQKALSMLAHAYSYDVLLKIDNVHIRNFIQKDLQEKFESKVFKENHA